MTALAGSVPRTRSRRGLTPRQARYGVLLAAAVIVPPVLTRLGLLSDLWAFVIGIGVSYALMAISLNLLMGYAGQISLGHAGFLGVGAYLSGLLTARYAVPNLVALGLAAVLGAVVALVVGLPALRLRGLYLAITTIGFVVMMERSILQMPFFSRGSAGVALPRPQADAFLFVRNADYLAYLLVFLILFWAIDENVVRSKLGRAFHAIREDEEVARTFGIDVSAYKLGAFILSGALAGLAGALYGHLLLFANASVFDLQFSLLLLAFVVVGGMGHRTGVVIAATAFGIFPALLQELIEVERLRDLLFGWEFIFGSALLIYTLARHPSGVAGVLAERKERRHARAAGPTDDEDERIPAMPAIHTVGPGHRLAVGDTLLAVEGVTVRFGGLTAVDDASLWVPNGVIVGLIGPNGAGKTTLFDAICGLRAVDAGRISFLGQDLTDLPAHVRAQRGLARTFQRGGLVKSLSVTENLLLAQHRDAVYEPVAALAHGRTVAAGEALLRERAHEVIEALAFERYADTPVRNLSGGQRRIVEMAAALVTGPELLLLDEPSAGMAPGVVENLAERLRDVRDELGRTILLVEHHIPLVLDVCDLVYVLDHGQVIGYGEPEEVMHRSEVLDAYLGTRHVRQEVFS